MTTAEVNAQKLRGGYYTPQLVAAWLARWAVRSGKDRVLEPSCGDGEFLVAASTEIARRRTRWTDDEPQLVGVELIPKEADRAQERVTDTAQVCAGDFFDWLASADSASFDVVLGNPPFIRYQNFPEPSRTRAMRFMKEQGLRPNRLTNIWVPFVVAGTALLRERGRLAMVLPAELLQVSYAAQIRQFLADSFRRITIFACNEMFFDKAEQEVVLLTADGKLRTPSASNRCDISIVSRDSVAEVLKENPRLTRSRNEVKFVRHDTEKWLKYFLSAKEIEFMRGLRENPAVGTLVEHASIDVGVVTGKNEFFVLSWPQIRQYGLEKFVLPLVGRSAQIPGTIHRLREHNQLCDSGQRVFLLHLQDRNEAEFTPGLRKLIHDGEDRGYHLGYKCRIRNPWYRVPSVWKPDCFFFRQIYDFPRVVVNKAKATSTDTIHRMRCRGTASRVAANLYTHLTAASAEIEGRSYGGGVLELEPTEAERLLVPRELNGAMSLTDGDKLVRSGKLSEVLEVNDKVVLRDTMGLSVSDCRMLKQVWSKMRDRRRARKRR